ncbi:FHA domain containing protein, putative [Leishmania guyanensis]|uniref:FHA domain-containing protein n=1 Tax=Leishmania guyanensis TaxID=5670 RepID=A0A1E1ISB7_LEIGU|nr:hypothetical protein, conserved [Leishmania guyanensis]
MYLLEVNHGDGEIHRHFLLPDQTYTLGRKVCRILLPVAEPSISRHHATIFVASMPRYSVLDPSAQLEIRIEDVSKHGTFVNRERIGKDNSRFLYPEDLIRLGLRVTARIIPVMLVLAISPDLTDASLDLVLDSCVRIGALVVEDSIPAPLSYYEAHTDCIGFLYVAENSFTMEETMMVALGYGYTLVTPHYIANLVRSLEKKDTLMPGEFPSPSAPLPASQALRSAHYRRPTQTFFSVAEFLSVGRPMAATVFCGSKFVLLESALQEVYSGVLRLFGGTVEVVALDAVGAWCSRQSSPPPLPLTTVVLVGEEDFRSVSDEVIKRDGGRGAFPTKHARPVICGYLTMYKCGLCLIPEKNVHLTLYRNDSKELHAKAKSCFLQRSADDVLADAALSPAGDAPLRLSSGSFTDTRSTSHHGSTIRTSESPASASPSPVAAMSPAPVIARRSRDSSFIADHSPNRAEKAVNGTAAASAATAAPAATTASPTGDVWCLTGSRAASPNFVSSLHPVHSTRSASASPQPTSVVLATSSSGAAARQSPPTVAPAPASAAAAPPLAHLDETSHVQDTATSVPLTVEMPVATTTVSFSGGAGGGGGGGSAVLRSRDRAADTSSTTMATNTLSTALAPQRMSVNSARRNSHPFSLSARQRSSGGDSDGEAEERAHNCTGIPLGSKEAEGSQGRRRSSSSSIRRASGSLHRLSTDNSLTTLSLRSEEVACLCPLGRSVSLPSGVAAAGTLLKHQSCATFEERPQRPSPASSEEPRCDSAPEEWCRRNNAAVTESAPADGAMPPLPPSSSTSSAIAGPTTNVTFAVPVLHPAGRPKSIPAQAAPTAATLTGKPEVSKPQRTEQTNGSATARESEVAQQLLSTRRGEQCVAYTSASETRCGLAQLKLPLDSVRNGAHHGGKRSNFRLNSARRHVEQYTTLEHDVIVHTASQASISSPRQRVEAVRIGSLSGRRTSVSHNFEFSLSRPIEPTENGADDVENKRRVVRRSPSSLQRLDSSQARKMAPPHRLMTPRATSSVPRNRRAQAYGGVPQSQSARGTEDGVAHKTSISDVTARRGSARRRLGSPTQGNGMSASSSSTLSAPRQIPSLHSGSVTSSGATASSGAAESYLRISKELSAHCQRFMSEFLDNFMSAMERTTRCAVQRSHIDFSSRQMLEEGVERILEFLHYINSTEADIPAVYSTPNTRVACHQVWQKSQYVLSKIKACYHAVNCKAPSVLIRARAALSTRTAPPLQQRRFTSVSGRGQSRSPQRMSAF